MDFIEERGRIYAENSDGTVIAEITFPDADGIADINHTFVDGCLRGQGVAGKLVSAAAAQLRQNGLKTKTSCSYAAKWFADRPEEQDLLAE